VAVENLQRSSRGNHGGLFTSEAEPYRSDALTMKGEHGVGDLVFSFQGKETIRLAGITDPEIVQKLVQYA
jgi:hypothetical protein